MFIEASFFVLKSEGFYKIIKYRFFLVSHVYHTIQFSSVYKIEGIAFITRVYTRIKTTDKNTLSFVLFSFFSVRSRTLKVPEAYKWAEYTSLNVSTK